MTSLIATFSGVPIMFSRTIAAFVLCMAGMPAAASTITFTNLAPLADADLSDVVSVSRFDPTLGSLSSVSWEVVGAIASILGIENNGSRVINGSVFVDVDFFLTSAAITVPGSPAFSILGTTGPVLLGIGESALFPVTAMTTITGTETPSAAFIGPGTIDLSFLTSTSFGGSGVGGDIAISQATDAGLRFSITYHYDVDGVIPLPASALLLVSGIGLLAMARRRRT